LDYAQALEYMASLRPRGVSLGLARIRALCGLVGNPQKKLKFIHIAGTNGKGSTAAMIANVLREAGYKTGLFTSPAVLDGREPLQVNGEMIGRAAFARLATEIEPSIDLLAGRNMYVTEFEALTAMALLHFARSGCDLVVLEVGLGGREDATNVIDDSLVSVILSIALDHMAFLGNTVQKIAHEKCGIIRPGGVTVTYPEQGDAMPVIEEAVRLNRSMFIVPSLDRLEITRSGIEGSAFRYGDVNFTLRLIGEHMVKNAAVAIEVLKALRAMGYAIDDSALTRGIYNTTLPARMELCSESPLLLIDGGHNEGCALALRAVLQTCLPGKKVVAVCAMMSDKDYIAYLRILAPRISFLIATGLPMERALPARALCDAATEYRIGAQCVEDCEEAVTRARAMAAPEGVTLVCGSFFLAKAIRKYTTIRRPLSRCTAFLRACFPAASTTSTAWYTK